MRYAIAYVSSADPVLTPEDVSDIFKKTMEYNIGHNINGILLYSENNFLQLIEGEEKIVKELYSKIESNPIHKNIIKFLEKPVTKPSGGGYICENITESTECKESQRTKFLSFIETLDPSSKTAVKRVIEAVII